MLSPNSHISRYDKAEAVRTARLEALALARNAGAHLMQFPEGRIGMTITFYFPDDRRRDIDNCLASLKGALDGIADALGINDERLLPVLLDRGLNVPGGQVVVRIGDTISTERVKNNGLPQHPRAENI